jgi:hypothetical protein
MRVEFAWIVKRNPQKSGRGIWVGLTTCPTRSRYRLMCFLTKSCVEAIATGSTISYGMWTQFQVNAFPVAKASA